jgi:hypothetical protein
MQIAIFLFGGLALVGFAVVAITAGSSAAAGVERDPDVVEEPGTESLRYRVPVGQDPAVVVSALRQEGYDAVPEQVPEGHDVVVPCPRGRDVHRARVRATIQHTNASSVEGDPYDVPPVTFADESRDHPRRSEPT